MSVEQHVHEAFTALAQQLADQYGVRCDEVKFSWVDVSTNRTVRSVVVSADVDSEFGRLDDQPLKRLHG